MTNKEIHTAIKIQARQQQREVRQQQKQALRQQKEAAYQYREFSREQYQKEEAYQYNKNQSKLERLFTNIRRGLMMNVAYCTE